MKKTEWKFLVEIDIKARNKEAAELKIAKILNRKTILNYKIKKLIWSYNGGTYFCPEKIEVIKDSPNKNKKHKS